MSATIWYIILIVQPYLYSKDKLKAHRTFGIIGFLVAGFVAASALSVVRGHIMDLDAEFDIIYDYRYSLSLTDFIYIAGFLFALVMSIITRKQIEKHSRWMISTVFWVFSPATDRFTFFVINPSLEAQETWFTFDIQFWISHVFVIAILVVLILNDLRKGKKVWAPYTIIAVVHLITPLLLVGLKDSESLAAWFEHMYNPNNFYK